MNCNVCDTELGAPLYEAQSKQALTSLCELKAAQVRIWRCPSCCHLLGEPLSDTREFYETEYRISLNHDDEDQIYEVRGDRIVYRTEHQVATLLSKLDIPAGAMILDYGCAKASTIRRLLSSRADLQVHLFDVSAMYRPFWEQFVPSDRCAIHDIPTEWFGRFDIVTSFFALEHIPEPKETVRNISRLLNENGIFYGIVPDPFGNVADFVVVDHVNHFTNISLYTLLRTAGFTNIHIDDSVHRGALVFRAGKHDAVAEKPDLTRCQLRSTELARYWKSLNMRIQAAETEYADQPIAIYGSGFYGAYIASTLCNQANLRCFLDASPFQQRKRLFGKPILAPEALPDDVEALFIGLNPKIARSVVAEMAWLRKRKKRLKLVFLDEDSE